MSYTDDKGLFKPTMPEPLTMDLPMRPKQAEPDYETRLRDQAMIAVFAGSIAANVHDVLDTSAHIRYTIEAVDVLMAKIMEARKR